MTRRGLLPYAEKMAVMRMGGRDTTIRIGHVDRSGRFHYEVISLIDGVVERTYLHSILLSELNQSGNGLWLKSSDE